MYDIDPSRQDLIEEYRANPDGPHSAELTLVVNRLRMMPMHERHVLICTKRGEEWMLARIPAARGVPVELFEDQVFTDYRKADWEVFKRRWKT
ncbi:MAG: hypothetical protein AAGF50_12105, partial [Pseudomonadota bacterium]